MLIDHANIDVCIFDDLNQLDKDQFQRFIQQCEGPIFYQWEFLLAAQEHPLLPVESCQYFVAFRNAQMVAFTQSYCMTNADPFGVISSASGIDFTAECRVWLSHIMHFYESTIVAQKGDEQAIEAVLDAMQSVAHKENSPCVGLINVSNESLMKVSESKQWSVNHMWDRYYIDFSGLGHMEDLIAQLNRKGRNEMRRQIRKFESSYANCRIVREPFDGLEDVAELCFETTKKNGTPQYYPVQPFVNFVRCLGSHALVFVIEQDQQLLGALVCFEEANTLHLWAGGMRYDSSLFSPYTILFYHTYLYALENGLKTVEAGRTNHKIKQRLGFSPKPLYSILKSGQQREK